MMKKILMLTVLSLSIISCKKDKKNVSESTGTTQPSYAYVSKPGSYWIYDQYTVDSMGNETLLSGQITITVESDTTINGKVYHKFKGDILGNTNTVSFQRDSSGYIVNDMGSILYSFNNVATELSSINDNGFIRSAGIEHDEVIQTAFGEKTACVQYWGVANGDGSPIDQCGDTIAKLYAHYVSGIGMVQNDMGTYWGMMQLCSRKRCKLSSYYIAP